MKALDKIKKILFVMIPIVLVTSCGNNKQSTDNTFVARISADFASLSPLADLSASTRENLRNMNAALYKYDTEKGKYVYDMAESIVVDKNIYDIKIKPNMKFHNEETITSEDIKYSFERLAGKNSDFNMTDETWKNLLDETKGGKIDIINDLELKVTFNESAFSSDIIYNIADAVIVPHKISELEQEKNPIGAGPYKFVSYKPGDGYYFTRFDNYFGDKPSIKNIKFKIFPDTTSETLAFKKGELNYILMNAENSDQIKKIEGVNITSSLGNDVNVLFMNFNVKPFDDIDVRKAFNYAVNKKRIIDISTKGQGQVCDTQMSPFMENIYNFDLKNTYNQDVEKSKKIMESKGYNEKNHLKITLKTVAENKINNDMAVLIKSDLEKIYVDVNIQSVPWSQYLTDVYFNHNYEMTILQLVGYANPYNILKIYKSSDTGNVPSYKSEKYDNIMEKSYLEFDYDKQIEYFKEAQQILVDDAVAIFIGDQGKDSALSNGYTDFVNYPFSFVDISKIKKTS